MPVLTDYENMSNYDLLIHHISIQLALKKFAEDSLSAMRRGSEQDFDISIRAMSKLGILLARLEAEINERPQPPADNAADNKENNAANAA